MPTAAETAELLEALEYVQTFRRMETWHPYPKQKMFFRLGATKRERIFLAGNQVGKCISRRTRIDHPDGTSTTAGELYDRGEPFSVWSWNGEKLVEAVAVLPIKKPAEQVVRIWLEDGSWFESALNHRVLTRGSGWLFVGRLLECVPCLPESSLEFDRPAHALDVLSWPETAPGWRGRCFADSHRYGGLLHAGAAVGPAFQTFAFDALTHSRPSLHWDVREPKHTNILPPACDRLSSPGDRARALARSWLFLAQEACRPARQSQQIPQALLLPAIAAGIALRSIGAILQGRDRCEEALETPIDGNQVIAYSPIGVEEIYDFTVPIHHNYLAAGVIHHNTEAGAFEAMVHSTGLYPDWWDGKRFNHKTVGWVAGVSSNDVKRVAQRKLCGPPGVESEWGTGLIPKDCLLERAMSRGVTDAIDELQVQHFNQHGRKDGVSRIIFKSYEQGRKTFQGDTIDWGWGDEEPDPTPNQQGVYPEFVTRLAGHGIMFTTYTPNYGPTEFTNRFSMGDDDKGMVSMRLREVPDKAHGGHFTDEEMAAREREAMSGGQANYDARILGLPRLGEGVIFTTAEANVIEPPLDYIPPYWAKGWGIDFGIGHPFGAALCFWDKDNDIVHVHHAYRAKDTLSIVHAAALKRVAAGCPVFWPKDGADRDPHGGGTLADGYKKHGLLMFGQHAHWPDKSLGTEAGIQEWDEREKTGRIKFAAHLAELLEERRYYHRKEGKIVKIRDDILSAVRIFLMMKRFARTGDGIGPTYSQKREPRLARNVDFDLFP